MSEADLTEAVRRRKVRRSEYAGTRYQRVMDDFRSIPRGTVLDARGVVYGYPHIGRVLALRPGLAEQLEAPFWIEEKIDGYNVRICRLGERTVALSRGGFVCPFTTDRLPDLIDTSVLDAEPDLVLCAEVAGPGNPYVEGSPPFIADDVQLFVFDLMRRDRAGFVSQRDKHALLERFGLPAVERFGRYRPDDLDGVRDVMRRLNDRGSEGAVFKEDSERDRRVKYVTASSSIQDIRMTAGSILDLPPEYFINRILRMALFQDDQGLGRSAELERRLGAAFIDGLHDAIDQFRAEHRVSSRFRCRFRERDNAERMIEHLKRAAGRNVQVNIRELAEQDDGYWLLAFDRVYPSLNGLLGHLLGGGVIYD